MLRLSRDYKSNTCPDDSCEAFPTEGWNGIMPRLPVRPLPRSPVFAAGLTDAQMKLTPNSPTICIPNRLICSPISKRGLRA